MFGAMTRRISFFDPEPERLLEASFDDDQRRGASPYLTTVDRVGGWMRTQLHSGERRATLAAAAEGLSFGMAPIVNRRFRP